MIMKMKNENQKNGMTERISTYIASEKTVYENECALFNLLIDHPIYQKRIRQARESLSLPNNGLASAQEAYDWEHKNHNNKLELLMGVKDVISDFNIPQAFRSDATNFTSDYIVCEKRVLNLLMEEFNDEKWKRELQKMTGRKKVTLKVVRTTADREQNKFLMDRNSVYLKVNPEIKFEDLRDAFQEIRKMKKELRPFYVPKPQEISRLIWRLRQEKTKPKDIIIILRDKYSKKADHHFVDVYTQRYKKDLSWLFPLPKKNP